MTQSAFHDLCCLYIDCFLNTSYEMKRSNEIILMRCHPNFALLLVIGITLSYCILLYKSHLLKAFNWSLLPRCVGYCNFRTFYDNTFIPPSSIIDLSKSKKRDAFYEIWVDKQSQKTN